MRTSEVYIGNDKTITVQHNEDKIFYLDIEKMEEIYNGNKGKEIVIGATGDWYWTARTIKDEDIEKWRKGYGHLLRASDWSRFSVEVDGESQDCTIEIPMKFHKLAGSNGFSNGLYKIEFWITGFYSEFISKMKYKDIKEMVAEIEQIKLKYKDKINP